MNNNPYTFNNPYMQNYSQQSMIERIDGQINQLQQMKDQMKNSSSQQQNTHPAINQTFQLAPNGMGGIRYVVSIDEVAKENVYVDTPFFSKDMSVVWIKKSNGEIRAFELNEIIEKDEKDLQIEFLQSQLNELKGMIKNEQSNTNVIEPKNATNTKEFDEPIGEPIKESKPTSVQRVSTSKKKQ